MHTGNVVRVQLNSSNILMCLDQAMRDHVFSFAMLVDHYKSEVNMFKMQNVINLYI